MVMLKAVKSTRCRLLLVLPIWLSLQALALPEVRHLDPSPSGRVFIEGPSRGAYTKIRRQPQLSEQERAQIVGTFLKQVFTDKPTRLDANQVFLRLQNLQDSRHTMPGKDHIISRFYELNELNPTDCDLDERAQATQDSLGLPALKVFLDDRNSLQYYACFRQMRPKLDRVLSSLKAEEAESIRFQFGKLKEALELGEDGAGSGHSDQVDALLLAKAGLSSQLIEGLVRYVCLVGQCEHLKRPRQLHLHKKKRQNEQHKVKKSSGIIRLREDQDDADDSDDYDGNDHEHKNMNEDNNNNNRELPQENEWQFRQEASRVLIKPCERALEIVRPIKRFFDILRSYDGQLLLTWLDPFTRNAMLGARLCELILHEKTPITPEVLWSVRRGLMVELDRGSADEREHARRVLRKTDRFRF